MQYAGNALSEYHKYVREDYKATADEWEDWAKRIVQSIEAELEAVKKDYEHIVSLEAEKNKLEAENERLKQELFHWEALYERPDPKTKPPSSPAIHGGGPRGE